MSTAPAASRFAAVLAAYVACVHARGAAWAIDQAVFLENIAHYTPPGTAAGPAPTRTLLESCVAAVAARKAAEERLEAALRASMRASGRSPQEIALVDAIRAPLTYSATPNQVP